MAAIEQMSSQVAKRDSLNFGVGRTTETDSFRPQDAIRLDAQKHECEALIAFHAGKALETSLQIVYAVINDRIPGRESPGVTSNQLREDRKTHKLTSLYDTILRSVEDDQLREGIEGEFESLFQTVHHERAVDVVVDGERLAWFLSSEDIPFAERIASGFRHGVEITLDHSDFGQAVFPQEQETAFSKLPCRNFREFLHKADQAHYDRRDLRWSQYSARDHERGRPYVVVGSRFFARLVQRLVGMAQGSHWIWHKGILERWCERRRAVVPNLVRNLVSQEFVEDVDLPDLIPFDAMMDRAARRGSWRTDDYDSLHATRLEFRRSNQP